jgi:hypothetical protein
MRLKKILWIVSASIVAVVMSIIGQWIPAQAQTALNWSTPARIPGLRDSNIDPVILPDSEGSLHVFHSQSIAGDLSILYIRWSIQQGWSNLVDIITSPQGDARIYGVHLDDEGWLHLVFFGGDDLSASMYYSRAPAANASKSSYWSKPLLIGGGAITPSNAAMLGTDDGLLVVAYSGNLKGNGFYYVLSQDGGESWSSPEAMYFTNNDQLWPFGLRLTQGQGNRIYAAWSLRGETGNSTQINFAYFDTESLAWSAHQTLATVTDFTADEPEIIEHEGKLILVYNNDEPSTRWMRFSSDGGETWSNPVRLFQHVGLNGAPTMAVDGDNTLYLMFGNRIGNPAVHGVWFSQWLEDRWSQPAAVVSSPQVRVGPEGEEGFDPSYVRSAVIQGNILFAIWRHDPQAGPTNVWFSYRVLDVPAEPFRALPTIEFTPEPLVNPSATLIVTETPAVSEPDTSPALSTATSEPESQDLAQDNNPSISLMLGIGAVVMLIVLAVVIQSRRQT